MFAPKCSFLFVLIFYVICDVTSGCQSAIKRSFNFDGVSDCVLSLNQDFGNPTPVFLRHGSYMRPNKDGAISFRRSETVQVNCPGDRRHIVLGDQPSSYAVLEAHCIVNATFRVDRWIGQFKDIRCNTQPTFTAEETRDTCHRNSKIYKVGYKIKNVLYPLYEACFNQDQLHTLYVKHQLSPTSSFMQTGLTRPQFTEGGLYGKVRMSQLYKIAHQNSRLDAILGSKMAEHYITPNKQFITRGHLAARADFSLGAELRASFHYLNTAPQWLRGNAGDWGALEDALRRRVRTLGANVTVLTGAHDVMTLRDRPLYLAADENNNGLVPVPMYFYKLVYDPLAKTAVAFISINSSFYNKTMIQDLVFCEDICEQNRQFSWLKWRSNDGTFSFCCEYEDFVNTVNYLPKFEVEGIFH